MSDAVVVVAGPTTVLGPGPVDAELAEVALECIDDDLALVDDRVVPVGQLWRDLMGTALQRPQDSVVLVCPSWWSELRVARVEAAVREWSAHVTVRRRVDVLGLASTVVEVAAELVVLHTAGQRRALPRVGACADVVDAIVAGVGDCLDVTVDVASSATRFGSDLSRALRNRSVAVTLVDDAALVRAERAPRTRATGRRGRWWRPPITPRAAVLVGAVLSTTALVVAALRTHADPLPVHWLVEGRVAVEVPARWTVERITSGPGSARVQVVSPADRFAALHLTQSRVPADQTLDETAETLRIALSDEPDGTFVDFTSLGRRGQRPVVTYREIRAERHVDWAVLLDRGVRIAIGCQGSPADRGPEHICDRAIRSAHAVA